MRASNPSLIIALLAVSQWYVPLLSVQANAANFSNAQQIYAPPSMIHYDYDSSQQGNWIWPRPGEPGFNSTSIPSNMGNWALPGERQALDKVKRTLLSDVKQGKLNEAEYLDRKYLETYPSSTFLHDELTTILIARAKQSLNHHDFATAGVKIREALAEDPVNQTAKSLYNQIAQKQGLNLNKADVHIKLADQAFARGKYQEAWTEYQTALNIAPTVVTYVGLGNIAFKEGQLANASYLYQQALQIDPKNNVAIRQKGLVEYAMHDIIGANNDFNMALKIDPHDRLAGQALLDLWHRQVALYPNEVKSHLGLARAFLELDCIDCAQEEYREVVRLDPDNPQLPTARASVQKALAKREAFKDYDMSKVLEGQGNYPEAYNKMAEALSYYASPELLFYRGQLAEKVGSSSEARTAYLEALKENPQYPQAVARLNALNSGDNTVPLNNSQMLPLFAPVPGGGQQNWTPVSSLPPLANTNISNNTQQNQSVVNAATNNSTTNIVNSAKNVQHISAASGNTVKHRHKTRNVIVHNHTINHHNKVAVIASNQTGTNNTATNSSHQTVHKTTQVAHNTHEHLNSTASNTTTSHAHHSSNNSSPIISHSNHTGESQHKGKVIAYNNNSNTIYGQGQHPHRKPAVSSKSAGSTGTSSSNVSGSNLASGAGVPGSGVSGSSISTGPGITTNSSGNTANIGSSPTLGIPNPGNAPTTINNYFASAVPPNTSGLVSTGINGGNTTTIIPAILGLGGLFGNRSGNNTGEAPSNASNNGFANSGGNAYTGIPANNMGGTNTDNNTLAAAPTNSSNGSTVPVSNTLATASSSSSVGSIPTGAPSSSSSSTSSSNTSASTPPSISGSGGNTFIAVPPPSSSTGGGNTVAEAPPATAENSGSVPTSNGINTRTKMMNFGLQNVSHSASGDTLKVILKNNGDRFFVLPPNQIIAIKNPCKTEQLVKAHFFGKVVPPHGSISGIIRIPSGEFGPTTDIYMPNFYPCGIAQRDLYLSL